MHRSVLAYDVEAREETAEEAKKKRSRPIVAIDLHSNTHRECIVYRFYDFTEKQTCNLRPCNYKVEVIAASPASIYWKNKCLRF